MADTVKPPNAGKGRPKGSRNKTTVAMRDAILHVYEDLQAKSGRDHGHFSEWAEENATEFYKIAAKLIPLDVNANVNGQLGLLPKASVDDFLTPQDDQ